jgi:hypothetical protein
MRLATTILLPRCPACRLACLPRLLKTRPCLRCYVPIPTLPIFAAAVSRLGGLLNFLAGFVETLSLLGLAYV